MALNLVRTPARRPVFFRQKPRPSRSLFLSALLCAVMVSPAASAEEPPWSRPPAWLQGTGTAGSPVIVQGQSWSAAQASSAQTQAMLPPPPSAGSSIIVGAESFTPPVPEYGGPPLPPVPAVAPAAPVYVPPAPRALPVPGVPAQPASSGLPLWELGVIGGVASTPDYPAASQNHLHYLALPMVRYRGSFLRSDEKGLVRGRFYHSDNFELDVSLNGSFPANSDKNDARKGMPNLNWMGEIGPRVQWTIARPDAFSKIDAELPVRAVFSTDFHSDVSCEGWVVEPTLAWQQNGFLNTRAAIKTEIGSTFGSRDLNETFYGVNASEATASRPAYEAEGGYMGSKVQLGLALPVSPWFSLTGRLRADLHQGAANENSPLFRDDMTWTAGVGAVFTLAKSKTLVGSDRQ